MVAVAIKIEPVREKVRLFGDKNSSTTRLLIFLCVGNVRSSAQLPRVRAQRDASAFEAKSPACGRAR